jgi:hypothetical protein
LYLDVLRQQPVEQVWVGGLEVNKVLEFLDWGRLHREETEACWGVRNACVDRHTASRRLLTSLALDLEALHGGRSQTVGAQVFTDLGWVGRVKVAAPVWCVRPCIERQSGKRSTYVVLSWRGGRCGREVEDMVPEATVAMERKYLVLRKEIWEGDERRGPFINGLRRCIESAGTIAVPGPPQEK